MGEHSTFFVGIDIGDRYCQIAVLDEDGEVSETSRIRTTPAAFKRYFQGKSPMRVAMEVGTHSPWLAQLVDDLGHEALVGNACKLRLIHRNNQKSDEVDAELVDRKMNAMRAEPIQEADVFFIVAVILLLGYFDHQAFCLLLMVTHYIIQPLVKLWVAYRLYREVNRK